MKHRLKMFLRSAWARLLYHGGLHALVDRLMPRRMTVLTGHCVDAPEHNAFLPRDMKIRREKLRSMLEWFGRRYELTTVADGVRRLEGGAGRSVVCLTMDDGYRDNATHLRPLLAELGVPATVFLESRALDERVLNWSHKFFWLLGKMTIDDLVHRYTELAAEDEAVNIRMNQIVAEGRPGVMYQVKRLLKYDAARGLRDRALDAIFAEQGGDERALCEALYMTWDDARALRAAGVEIGGHTMTHEVLSTLSAEDAEREVAGGREAITRELAFEPETFAYPFGRRWDFHDDAVRAVERSGFRWALTTHAGTNRPGADPLRLKRLMIDEDADMALLVAEACGGFDLLRKVGLDLSE